MNAREVLHWLQGKCDDKLLSDAKAVSALDQSVIINRSGNAIDCHHLNQERR